MTTKIKSHSFHIPVMGTGFTIDSPIKVAQYGISSVISLVDDLLIEKMREFYSKNINEPFHEISNKIEDYRAKRITAYLNLVDKIVEDKFEELKNSIKESSATFDKYMHMLPNISEVKQKFQEFSSQSYSKQDLLDWAHKHLTTGSIDVNIMTKLDKVNYRGDEELPSIHNDAHAALRGYANSDLESSIIFSAGMNPRLYGYIGEFEDFYPDENGYIKKKIVIKVSDYRSAMIQGKFLAKKGLWVSEYRIESGLNCGGHAFATEGLLMGPILKEFKIHREELINDTHSVLCDGLKAKDRHIPTLPLPLKITTQGGVGTAEEHDFLLDEYNLDSVGWASPFLLVPEASTVDDHTLQQLAKAKEEDLYLSGISPLGVPFNTLRGNTQDDIKHAKIDSGRPGSSCPKQFLVSSKEFSDRAICTASRQFQRIKIKELDAQEDLSSVDRKITFDKITNKSCICVGLGTSAMRVANFDVKGEGVSICPGPNLAYFSSIVPLQQMVGHIYGNAKVALSAHRPNMFMKELKMYIKHLREKMDGITEATTDRQLKGLAEFQNNLMDGVHYYQELAEKMIDRAEESATKIKQDIDALKMELMGLELVPA
ncbi:MAG: hypothetical protein L3J29_12595 [Cyclobacteriaceae bacterium]|nr:hypothetical protein [Cyclobacteriaceae bacterium]